MIMASEGKCVGDMILPKKIMSHALLQKHVEFNAFYKKKLLHFIPIGLEFSS